MKRDKKRLKGFVGFAVGVVDWWCRVKTEEGALNVLTGGSLVDFQTGAIDSCEATDNQCWGLVGLAAWQLNALAWQH